MWKCSPRQLAAAAASAALAAVLVGCESQTRAWEPPEKVYKAAAPQPGQTGAGKAGTGSTGGTSRHSSARGDAAGSAPRHGTRPERPRAGKGGKARPPRTPGWRPPDGYGVPSTAPRTDDGPDVFTPVPDSGDAAGDGDMWTPEPPQAGDAEPIPTPTGKPPVLSPDRSGYPRMRNVQCRGGARGPWTVSFTLVVAPGVSRQYTDITVSGIPYIGTLDGYDVSHNFGSAC